MKYEGGSLESFMKNENEYRHDIEEVKATIFSGDNTQSSWSTKPSELSKSSDENLDLYEKEWKKIKEIAQDIIITRTKDYTNIEIIKSSKTRVLIEIKRKSQA